MWRDSDGSIFLLFHYAPEFPCIYGEIKNWSESLHCFLYLTAEEMGSCDSECLSSTCCQGSDSDKHQEPLLRLPTNGGE
jgi:hypothetical protein